MISKEEIELSEELAVFLQECPTAFHSAAAIQKRLDADGFLHLYEEDPWNLKPQGKYYVMRNSSGIVAFKTGKERHCESFRIAAVHGDYPCFKIKEISGIGSSCGCERLNVEGYGGMICYSWLDRPLSVAGRIVVKDGSCFTEKLVRIDRDLLIIPSLSIHMSRNVNEGYAFNKQVDMLPLWSCSGGKAPDLKSIIAEELKIERDSIIGSDLYLYCTAVPSIWGAGREFISAPHLDDMQCGFAVMKGFISADYGRSTGVFACFDNEEVGSETRQGAGSVFLQDIMKRINAAFGGSDEEYSRAIASSFCVSADNAHAVHPNHPEKTDETNKVFINKGIVIKSNASQKYASDAVSSGMFRAVCDKAAVPVQFFSNRSDSPGGSTLGNISSLNVPVRTVDIGLPQLAMHSSFETAGVKDTLYLTKASEVYYNSDIVVHGNSFTVI